MQTLRPLSAKDAILWLYAALRLFRRAPIAFIVLGLVSVITPNAAVLVDQPQLRFIIKVTLYLMSLLFFAAIVYAARAVDNGQTIKISLMFEGFRQRLLWRIVATFWMSGILFWLVSVTAVIVFHGLSHDSWSDIQTSLTMLQRPSTTPDFHQNSEASRQILTVITDTMQNSPAVIHFIVQCIVAAIIGCVVSMLWILSLPLVLFNAMSIEQAFRHSVNTTCRNFWAVGLHRLISIAVSFSIAILAVLFFAVTYASASLLHQWLGGFSQVLPFCGFILMCIAYCFILVYGYICQYVLWKQLIGPTAEEITAIAV